jgi:hypothetical protein
MKCAFCGVNMDETHDSACAFAGMNTNGDCKECGAYNGERHQNTCPHASPNDYQIGGDHYKELAVQPWAAMESWMSEAEFEGFLKGNVIKYLARAGKKDDELQDLKKALHYLEKLVSVKERRG